MDWGGERHQQALAKNMKTNDRDYEWLGTWLRGVFPYLTARDLLCYLTVCRNWKAEIRKHQAERKCLDLDVFWNMVGHREYGAKICGLVSQFPKCTSIKLTCCNSLNDLSLKHILEAMPTDCKRGIDSIDLFYCTDLTEAGVAHVVDHCPNLRILNLTFCCGINNDAIIHLSKLQKLEILNMSSLADITKDIWKLFQEYKFISLKTLIIENCSQLGRRGENKLLTECTRDGKDTEEFKFDTNNFEVVRESTSEYESEIEDEDQENEVIADDDADGPTQQEEITSSA